jgi:hypothetical protein
LIFQQLSIWHDYCSISGIGDHFWFAPINKGVHIMKPNKFTLTLIAAALLPTFAFAATDEVVASFERDLQRGVTVETPMVANAGTDPLVDAISTALYREEDAVVASFNRGLYGAASTIQTVENDSAADPLVDAISVALYGKNEVAVVSLERDKRL